MERVETVEVYTPAESIVEGLKQGLFEVRPSIAAMSSAARTELQEQLQSGRQDAAIRSREIVEEALASPEASQELAQELMDVTLAAARLERASIELRGLERARASSILRVAESAEDLGAMAQALQREVVELAVDGKKALLDALEDRREEIQRERSRLEEERSSPGAERAWRWDASANREALSALGGQAERVELIKLLARSAIRDERTPRERGLER